MRSPLFLKISGSILGFSHCHFSSIQLLFQRFVTHCFRRRRGGLFLFTSLLYCHDTRYLWGIFSFSLPFKLQILFYPLEQHERSSEWWKTARIATTTRRRLSSILHPAFSKSRTNDILRQTLFCMFYRRNATPATPASCFVASSWVPFYQAYKIIG